MCVLYGFEKNTVLDLRIFSLSDFIMGVYCVS